MNGSDPTFQKFRAYSQLSEEMIADAAKEDPAETAYILAMRSAHYARKCSQEALPALAHLLSATSLDKEAVGLLRDGTEALVGLQPVVSHVGGVDIDEPV